MLSRDAIKEYRNLSGLSYRDVASYCDISFQLIEMVENGKKDLTEHNYKEIIKGINAAKQAKKNGTFKQIDKTEHTPNSGKEIKANSDKDNSNVKQKNFNKQEKVGVHTNEKV